MDCDIIKAVGQRQCHHRQWAITPHASGFIKQTLFNGNLMSELWTRLRKRNRRRSDGNTCVVFGCSHKTITEVREKSPFRTWLQDLRGHVSASVQRVSLDVLRGRGLKQSGLPPANSPPPDPSQLNSGSGRHNGNPDQIQWRTCESFWGVGGF